MRSRDWHKFFNHRPRGVHRRLIDLHQRLSWAPIKLLQLPSKPADFPNESEASIVASIAVLNYPGLNTKIKSGDISGTRSILTD